MPQPAVPPPPAYEQDPPRQPDNLSHLLLTAVKYLTPLASFYAAIVLATGFATVGSAGLPHAAIYLGYMFGSSTFFLLIGLFASRTPGIHYCTVCRAFFLLQFLAEIAIEGYHPVSSLSLSLLPSILVTLFSTLLLFLTIWAVDATFVRATDSVRAKTGANRDDCNEMPSITDLLKALFSSIAASPSPEGIAVQGIPLDPMHHEGTGNLIKRWIACPVQGLETTDPDGSTDKLLIDDGIV